MTSPLNISEKPLSVVKVAARFVVLVLLANLSLALLLLLLPTSASPGLGTNQILLATLFSCINTLSWVGIALGVFLKNNIRVLYFLSGMSFKTTFILLLVHQLKNGPQGFLHLQLVIVEGSLFLLLFIACIFRSWILKNTHE